MLINEGGFGSRKQKAVMEITITAYLTFVGINCLAATLLESG